MVKALLKAEGIDVNKGDARLEEIPLIVASKQGYANIVELLKAAGAKTPSELDAEKNAQTAPTTSGATTSVQRTQPTMHSLFNRVQKQCCGKHYV